MQHAATFGALNYTVLVVYLVSLVVIGVVLAGKQQSVSDYFLAGRRMPWLAIGMSLFASIASAVTYVGVPGIVYSENISFMGGILMWPFVAPFIIWLFLPFYQRLQVTTSYEYIALRFGTNARFAIAALFVLARTGWLGAVIFAPSVVLTVVTGIPIWACILIIGALGTFYTVLGGLAAVIWTDVLQFMILLIGTVWVALSLLGNVQGGFSEILSVAEAGGRLNFLQWRPSLTEMTISAVAISYFFQFMHDYGIDQVAVQRLFAARSLRAMALATVANAIFTVCIVGLLAFIGLGLYAYHQQFPALLPEGLKADGVFPHYIVHALPAGVSGLLVTCIFAAAMSSMDSGVNSLATVVMSDFVMPLRGRREEQTELRLARWLTLGFGVFGTAMAFLAARLDQVMAASQTFLGLFLGPVLALFLMGMLTMRGSFRGWLIALPVALLLTVYVQRYTSVHFIYYFPLSFLSCFVIGWLASLALPQQGDVRDLTIWRG